ncbi:UDP-glycosyltransferase 73C1 [Morus notabilis]|uniref:Glycosyltransferase n=1 Tax=Morus notabilis TaxID=981085 RepID=W9RGI4_9ROSA|nr:UDP-glycosyltransferase 73C1 [Morus notabilis]EXB75925.1 UDP-glycosyltransferase 73C1 [Morus notabilis]
MDSQTHQLHFLLIPLMAQGHMIPMVDTARLLAQRGVMISIVTTPQNASRFKPVLARAAPQIQFVELQLPCEEAGLPKGCENFDQLPSLGLGANIFKAASLLQTPLEKLFDQLTPRPSCIISDVCLPWTAHTASKFHIPRFIFLPVSCFNQLCFQSLQYLTNVLEGINSESDYFVLPGLPDQIEFTKSQLPVDVDPKLKEFMEQILEVDMASYGVVINTFEELEPAYAEKYRKARNGKIWCIGPVSLCNKGNLDKVERGKKAAIEETQCLKWLDSHEPKSVLYACLGSICNLVPAQLVELGLGLEASNKPFIWVIREGNISEELEKWIREYGFEERTKKRGLLIRGWAPQMLILSHQAVGGFLTHCGGNSSLEAVCAGLPVVTWPMFGDQFVNEKLLVHVLGVGVRVGVEKMVNWGEEEKTGVLVKFENVKEAIEKLMDGEEKEERSKLSKKLAEMAKKAVEEGGSSHLDITELIQDITQQAIGCEKPT